MKSSKIDRTVQWKKRTRTVAFILVLLTLTTTLSYAQQSIQLGLKAGTNYFKLGGRSFDNTYNFSFSGGAYANLNYSSKWSIQPELLFNQTLGKTSETFSQIYPGTVADQLVSLDYIALPILAVFKPIPQLSILLGPQYGYLISQTEGLEPGTDKKFFSKSDFSLIFGAQLNLDKVKFGLRYSEGLNNINAINTSDTWRQFGFQAYLCFQIKDIKLK
jgi:hypothetical protein